jgi:hypothetical protein
MLQYTMYNISFFEREDKLNNKFSHLLKLLTKSLRFSDVYPKFCYLSHSITTEIHPIIKINFFKNHDYIN